MSGNEFRTIEQIYERVFPPAERRPLRDVLQANSRSWLAHRRTDIVGFALAAVLKETNTALLQYIGVAPDTQSHGVGTSLLHEMYRDFAMTGVDAILLEIEDPDSPGADHRTVRRLAFYRRWGAERLACMNRYYIPDMTDPGHRLSMLLLWRPLETSPQPSGTALKSILTDIFMNEYAHIADMQHLSDLHQEVRC